MNRTVVGPALSRAAAVVVALLLVVLASDSPVVRGQDADPPATPTGLTGTVSHNQVALTWDHPGDDSITGYQILRLNRAVDDLGEYHIHVDDTGSPDNSYLDRDVSPKSRYVYRIKARNEAGLSGRSRWFEDADTPPMPAPTGLTGTVSHNQVALTWDDPADDTITGYQVLRRNRAVDDLGVFHVHVDDTGSPATSYVDKKDVEAETKYVYRIKARYDGGIERLEQVLRRRHPGRARA